MRLGEGGRGERLCPNKGFSRFQRVTNSQPKTVEGQNPAVIPETNHGRAWYSKLGFVLKPHLRCVHPASNLGVYSSHLSKRVDSLLPSASGTPRHVEKKPASDPNPWGVRVGNRYRA